MSAPPWALTLSYLLHMLATVVWIGGLAALALLIFPALQLEQGGQAALAAKLQKRLDNLIWFSLVLLAGTGLVQMSASQQYEGFLAINSAWSAAILVKHAVYGVMIALSAYQTWGILPRLQRAGLLEAKGMPAGDAGLLVRRNRRLVLVNLALGAVVLALTAVARVAA